MPKELNELIIYLEDQLMYWFTLEDKNCNLLKKVSMSSEIYQNGEILDESHLHYLLKKHLDAVTKLPKSIDIIINSDRMINRSLKTPKLSSEEEEDLIKNELPQLFIQDLKEYSWTKTVVRESKDGRLLLLTITPKAILEKFYTLFNKLGIEKINLYSKASLLIYYLETTEGGAIYEHNLRSLGYHYLNGDQVYTKYYKSEGLEGLFKDHPMDFMSICSILNRAGDEITSEIDADKFEMDFFDGLYGDLHTIQNLGDSFPELAPHFKAGTLFDEELMKFTDPILDEEGKTLISYEDLSRLLKDHRNNISAYSNGPEKTNDKYKFLKISAIVSLLILLGAYFVGQQLQSQVDEQKSTESYVEQRNLDLDSPVDESVININDKYQDQYPEIINQVFLTKPEDSIVTSVFIEEGTTEVSGQVNTEDDLDSWITELEKITGQKAAKDSSAQVDGVIYFKFTIGRTEEDYV